MPRESDLNSEEFAAIKKEYAQGDVPQKALAAKYGVSQSTISKIVNSKHKRSNDEDSE